MAKKSDKSHYACQSCGASFTKWMGQCAECGVWNEIQEVSGPAPGKEPASTGPIKPSRSTQANWAGGNSGQRENLGKVNDKIVSHRLSTGNTEFDRVLGGVGVVVGSVVLLGGDPGIGKSTLLLQTMALMGHSGKRVLYVAGEESLQQVAQRGIRLELPIGDIEAIAETEVETILATAEDFRPEVMVIDSIQTMQTLSLNSSAGTVSQVRECAAALVRYAKTSGCIIFLVGHVTKTGDIAGPRILEHMVDTVLYFEGDPSSPYRLIRAIKNRFGAVNELGAFEMEETGLKPISNPSALFLPEDRDHSVGSSIFVMQEGQRAILLEIQALMVDTSGASPARIAVGMDRNRLAMILGVLSKHMSMNCGGLDVFINVTGGIRILETASDLPMCLAMLSSLREIPWSNQCASFGEIGLTGELRPVQYAENRIREAAKLGFKQIVVPMRNKPKTAIRGIEVLPAKNLWKALEIMKNYEGPKQKKGG